MTGDQLCPALRRTLVAAAERFATAQDPWWIIAGAAVALHGVGPIEIGDVDVLTSERDAQCFLHVLGIPATDVPASTLFRSRIFGTWRANPLPVEIMAGFQVRLVDRWHTVQPATRQAVDLADRRLFMPARDELAGMLRSFGRPKDIARARLLEGDAFQ